MEHISLVVRSVLARIANSGMIRLNAGEACCGHVTAISAQEEKGEKEKKMKNNEAILFEIEKEKEHLRKQIDEQHLSGLATYWLGQLDALERMRLLIIRYYGG